MKILDTCSLRVLSIVISGPNRLTSMSRGTKLVMRGKTKYNSGYKQYIFTL